MKQKVIVTIDTEGHLGENPVEKLILGNTKNGKFGIERIMDEFEKVGVKILFFVDFAEAWDYGENKIKKVVDCILSRGHDIGVHIHPDHMADKKKKFLWEYSYEEQDEMIYRCTKLYEKMVGKKPKSFRAGKYSANYNTLDILCKYGYRYDFSEYYGQKWCGINPPVTINAPIRYKDIVEFPVTMHRSIHIGKFVREDKVDIEAMCPGELKYALKQISNQPFEMVITLFQHSFSLLDWSEDPDNPVVNIKKIEKMSKAIQSVLAMEEFCFISESELASIKSIKTQEAMQSHIVWKSNIIGMYYTYQKAKFIQRRNKKARVLVLFIRLFCCALWLFMIFALVFCLE